MLPVALVGDFNPEVVAHQAIIKSFALAQQQGLGVEPVWTGTETLTAGDETQLRRFKGMWCVPASPYRNANGALWAIQFARTRGVPFIGTCGGYQHLLLEFAHEVLGMHQAEHAETHPEAALPLVSRMQCSLVEKVQKVVVTSLAFEKLYGGISGWEGYHCSFGLNPQFERLFAGTGLEIVARSEEGLARAVMLQGHAFFIGTQFQPERAALNGSLHPLVRSFFAACITGL